MSDVILSPGMTTKKEPAASPAPKALRVLHILLVEDDKEQRLRYRSHLEAAGCKVRAVDSAESGIFEAQNGAFDLILSDNVLPGMTGLRSLAEYAKCTKAPVIIMTSHYSEEVAKDGLLLGARAVLAKPLDAIRIQAEVLAAA